MREKWPLRASYALIVLGLWQYAFAGYRNGNGTECNGTFTEWRIGGVWMYHHLTCSGSCSDFPNGQCILGQFNATFGLEDYTCGCWDGAQFHVSGLVDQAYTGGINPYCDAGETHNEATGALTWYGCEGPCPPSEPGDICEIMTTGSGTEGGIEWRDRECGCP